MGARQDKKGIQTRKNRVNEIDREGRHRKKSLRLTVTTHTKIKLQDVPLEDNRGEYKESSENVSLMRNRSTEVRTL